MARNGVRLTHLPKMEVLPEAATVATTGVPTAMQAEALRLKVSTSRASDLKVEAFRASSRICSELKQAEAAAHVCAAQCGKTRAR